MAIFFLAEQLGENSRSRAHRPDDLHITLQIIRSVRVMIIYMEFNAFVFQTRGKISQPAGLAGINKNEFCNFFQGNLLLALEIEKIVA